MHQGLPTKPAQSACNQKLGRHGRHTSAASETAANGDQPAPTCGARASMGSGGRGTAGELSATGPRLRTACDTAGERCRLAARAGGACGAPSTSAAAAAPPGEGEPLHSASTTAGGLCCAAAVGEMVGPGAVGGAAAGSAGAPGACSLGAAGVAWSPGPAALPLKAVITKSCARLGRGGRSVRRL